MNIERKKIRGFTLKGFGYSLEFVTINYFLRCVALWKGNHFIKRIS
jgi:hypothetical protein